MAWFSEFDIRQIDDTYFKLLVDLVYFSKKYQVKITIPSGFISDGPSVGRWPILFWLFGKKGKKRLLSTIGCTGMGYFQEVFVMTFT